ncbi:MAG: TIGR00269 family protein, partial [Methanophagales archaeon]|nr:TIGR00269 family protein [Methanophagales archaeon]
MRCSKKGCNNPSIIYQRYSGLHLCKVHLVEDVERKVKKEMRKRVMVEKGDKIAVALSGGKDSSALLYILKKVFHERNDLEFFAISVDEGISLNGYRAMTLRNAETIIDRLGVDIFRFSFLHKFGFTVDEIVSKNFKQAPCTFCGVLRRQLIAEKAMELGATKVATAHNLDDEVQTILINYIRGDIERLGRLDMRHRRKEFVPRIKPLRTVPEEEVALYARIAGISVITDDCPYVTRSFRFTVKRMLNEFESKHPGTRYSLMRGYERVSEFLPARLPGRKLL